MVRTDITGSIGAFFTLTFPIGSGTSMCCFTLNNPTEDEMAMFAGYLRGPQGLPSRCNYIAFQEELSESGTPHLQGFIQSTCQLRRVPWQKMIMGDFTHTRVHVEKVMSSAFHANAYAQKEETRVEGGLGGKNGHIRCRKSTKQNFVLEIRNEISPTSLMDKYPVFTYDDCGDKKKNSLLNRAAGARQLKPSNFNNFIFVGPSGSGKSCNMRHFGKELMDIHKQNKQAYWVPDPTGGRNWMAGLSNHKVALFDDFKEQWDYRFMLRIYDIYSMKVEFKGGNLNWTPVQTIMSTVKDPCYWFTEDNKWGNRRELERRIQKNCQIVKFSGSEEDYDEDEPNFGFKTEFIDMTKWKINRPVFSHHEVQDLYLMDTSD